MKRNWYPFMLVFFLLSIIIASCGPTPTVQPAPETATATLPPAKTPTPASTETPSPSPTPELAPYCDLDALSAPPPQTCQVPMAEVSSSFCENKRPYNIILVNEGATYELLNEEFECSEVGVKDGKQMVLCTGQMAATFRVKVCDPACEPPVVESAVTKCAEGYFYNKYQGCCSSEVQVMDEHCELLQVDTKTCIVDCRVFRRKGTCHANSYACIWNEEIKKCDLRH